MDTNTKEEVGFFGMLGWHWSDEQQAWVTEAGFIMWMDKKLPPVSRVAQVFNRLIFDEQNGV